MSVNKRKAGVGVVRTIIVMILLALAVRFVYNYLDNMMYPLKYEYYISSYSQKYGLDKFLVAAVIKTESNFIPDAHSGKARGLMQLTDETALWIANKMDIEFQPEDVVDPQTNIEMGCYYLKYLIDKYDNCDTALAAYNGGMGNVSKWLADKKYSDDGKTLKYIPFEETRNYVVRVNKYKQIYNDKYAEMFTMK